MATPACWLATGDRRAGGHRLAVQGDLAARVGCHRSGQDAEHGGLARPVLTDDAGDLAEAEDELFDLQDGGQAVRLGHAVQGNAIGVSLPGATGCWLGH
jgi:hypothetical protein